MKKIIMILVSILLMSTFSTLPFFFSEAQAYPEIKQLTRNDFDDYLGSGGYSHDHALSWDGSKVVFWTKHSEYDFKVYVMNTTDDPGQEKMMTTAYGRNNFASISADGSKIVFGSNRKNPTDPWYSCEIFVMNTADEPGDEVQITDDAFVDHDPDISGNGEIIAWHSSPYEPTGWDIIVANISDMNNINKWSLVTGPDDVFYPSLTYDGKSMSFWNRDKNDVFFINTNGTGLRNLTNSPEYEFPADAISGDGKTVAFQRMVGGDYEIFVYNIATATSTQLTENDSDDLLGGLNGDGTVVTYSRDGHIFMHNMVSETQLTDGSFDDRWPRISGDGNTIVFVSNRDNPDYDIFMLQLKGPVGGVWVPINRFELLAPWIGLASLITIATVSVFYIKYRKKKQN